MHTGLHKYCFNLQVSLIEQNLAAQDNILKALTDAYARYAGTRKAVTEHVRKRDATINALISSYDAYEDLLAKSSKGLEFYRKLETNVSKLLQRVKGTCKVQEEEREQIIARNTKKCEVESVAPKLKDYLQGMKQGITGYMSGYASQIPAAYYNTNIAAVPSPQPPVSSDYSSQVPAESSVQQQFVPAVRPAPVGSEGTSEQTVAVKFDSRETEVSKQSYGLGMKLTAGYPATTYSTSTQYNYTDTYPYAQDPKGGAYTLQYSYPVESSDVDLKSKDSSAYYAMYSQYPASGPVVPAAANYQYNTSNQYSEWQQQQYYLQPQSVTGMSVSTTPAYSAYQTTMPSSNCSQYQVSSTQLPSTSVTSMYRASTPVSTAFSTYQTTTQPPGMNSSTNVSSMYSTPVSTAFSTYQTTTQPPQPPGMNSSTNASSMYSTPVLTTFSTYQTTTQPPGMNSSTNASSMYSTPVSTAFSTYQTTTQPPSMSSYQPIPPQYQQYQYQYSSFPSQQASGNIAVTSTEFQYMAGPGSSCYTNAGSYDTSQTCSTQIQYNGTPYQRETPYYSLPYGYQYDAEGTTSTTTAVVTQNPEGCDPQQNQSTYMQARGQNDNTTTTYSQQGKTSGSLSSSQTGVSCNGNDVKSASNVDLLAGLDFSLNQAPLVPQQQPSLATLKKEDEEEEDKSKSSPVKKVTSVSVEKMLENTISDSSKTIECLGADIKPISLDSNTEENKICKSFGKDPYTDPEALNQFVQEVGKYEKFVDGLTTKTLNGPTPLDMKWKELLELQVSEHEGIDSW